MFRDNECMVKNNLCVSSDSITIKLSKDYVSVYKKLWEKL